MPAPVVASVSTVASGSTASPFAMNAPSGVAVGDLLVLALFKATNGELQNTPSGWTQAAAASNVATALTIDVYYRVADGTSADTPTITWVNASGNGTGSGFIARITGQKASGAFDFAANTPNAFASSIAIPTGTVAENDSLCLAIGGDSAAATSTQSAGWTESLDSGSRVLAWRTSAAGTSPSGTLTFTASGRLQSSLIVIKPAAGGGGGGNSRYYRQQQEISA